MPLPGQQGPRGPTGDQGSTGPTGEPSSFTILSDTLGIIVTDRNEPIGEIGKFINGFLTIEEAVSSGATSLMFMTGTTVSNVVPFVDGNKYTFQGTNMDRIIWEVPGLFDGDFELIFKDLIIEIDDIVISGSCKVSFESCEILSPTSVPPISSDTSELILLDSLLVSRYGRIAQYDSSNVMVRNCNIEFTLLGTDPEIYFSENGSIVSFNNRFTVAFVIPNPNIFLSCQGSCQSLNDTLTFADINDLTLINSTQGNIINLNVSLQSGTISRGSGGNVMNLKTNVIGETNDEISNQELLGTQSSSSCNCLNIITVIGNQIATRLDTTFIMTNGSTLNINSDLLIDGRSIIIVFDGTVSTVELDGQFRIGTTITNTLSSNVPASFKFFYSVGTGYFECLNN